MVSKVMSSKELSKVDPVFGEVSFDDHEQVVFCKDKDNGLKAIIGIHNTVLGPAIGASRSRFSKQDAICETENICHTTLQILDRAVANDKTRNAAALSVARERIENRKSGQSK